MNKCPYCQKKLDEREKEYSTEQYSHKSKRDRTWYCINCGYEYTITTHYTDRSTSSASSKTYTENIPNRGLLVIDSDYNVINSVYMDARTKSEIKKEIARANEHRKKSDVWHVVIGDQSVQHANNEEDRITSIENVTTLELSD